MLKLTYNHPIYSNGSPSCIFHLSRQIRASRVVYTAFLLVGPTDVVYAACMVASTTVRYNVGPYQLPIIPPAQIPIAFFLTLTFAQPNTLLPTCLTLTQPHPSSHPPTFPPTHPPTLSTPRHSPTQVDHRAHSLTVHQVRCLPSDSHRQRHRKPPLRKPPLFIKTFFA